MSSNSDEEKPKKEESKLQESPNNEIKNKNNTNQNQGPEQNQEEDMNQSNSSIDLNITTYEVKLVFLGDSNVGKTSIIIRFCKNRFDENGTLATLSVAYSNKTIKVDPFTEVNMKIWDTAGQEKYRSMTRGYLRGAQGIFLVFDLSNKKSFNSLNSWLNEIKNSDIDKNCVKILIGNKSDFQEKEVDEAEANKFAQENNMQYLSVSAKDGVNIESMFEMMGGTCAKIIQELPDNEKYCKKPSESEDDKKLLNLDKNLENDIKSNLSKKNSKCC